MKKSKLFFMLAVFGALLLCFFACSEDDSARKEFERNMFSSYTAQAEYLVEFDGKTMSGEAVVTRGDSIRLDIVSPEPYSGMSVESDKPDKANMISIGYLGVKAEIPRSSLEKIVFMNGMFSDEAVCAIEKADKNAFTQCKDGYAELQNQGKVPYECTFSYGDTKARYIYEAKTGFPLVLIAENDRCRAEIKIKSIDVSR